MSGANVKMDLADVERLRQRFTAIGQDAMRLMQQVNGAAWEWEQLPTVREAGRAVRMAKELTAEAEELADFARRMMRGVERLQNENRLKMNLTFTVGKTWNPFGFGAYKQPVIGYGEVNLRMQQAAKMGISSVKPMPLMDAFQQDPVILGLKRIVASPNMTPEDRAAARSELERVLKLREDIGKAQTAYGMYKAYGNRVLMDAMHEMAEAARQELKSKGIREGLYAENVDLSPYFQKPAIEACDFDPSYTGQPVPLGDDPKYRLLLSLGAQEGKVRDWARGELAKVQDSAQWRVAAGVVREGIAGQLDRYNATIPAEKIREMQEYLKKMNLYQGKVTGVYDEGLMASVAAYQTLANTVNTKWMVWNGGNPKPFEINGGFNEDLLRLARSDAAQGMRNNPNLKLNNGMLMVALTYSSVTDGVISQLQDEGMALLGVLNPKTYSDLMDVGEAIINGELTLEQIGDTLGESAKEEFVKPFQDVNRLYARVLSGKASHEESKEFGRALAKSALAFTAVKGAVKAGIEGGKELVGRLPDLKLDLKPVAITPDGTWMRIGDKGIGGVQPLKPTAVQENYLKFMGEGTGKGIPKFDPLSNPKIAKEIETNPDAVYGYSPQKESPLDKFGVNWTNPQQVAYARAKRMEYLQKMEQKKIKLENEVAKLENEGMSITDIAKMKVEQRNSDRMQSYIDSNNYEGLAAMKERNIQQYGRPEGPTPEQLFEKYGSWEEVIYSSVRTSPAMDVLTGLYRQ
ncbi:peptidoglycan-binding domain-containing protein [Paenibacillus herberti]|uniref:peptidoglycan-binding domain-containing protein n=1 Tax=Paenibacillus herberti TaxID=1619309 RepID=UPI0015953564|nr:peptidoglycan-binding domain-containing protein [Paenibacillus herberti]